jgi:hypothetical protein
MWLCGMQMSHLSYKELIIHGLWYYWVFEEIHHILWDANIHITKEQMMNLLLLEMFQNVPLLVKVNLSQLLSHSCTVRYNGLGEYSNMTKWNYERNGELTMSGTS